MSGRSLLRHFGLVAGVMTAALVLGFVGTALGNSAGGAHLAGYSGQGGATCAACHNSGAVAPAVSITGPSPVLAGQTNTYTITVSGGQAVAGGFGLSASAGTLTSTSADTTKTGTELVQTSSKAVTGSSVSWSFDWTAQATSGTATLYASGNSVDGDGTFSGDRATSATLAITVNPGANQNPVAAMNGPFVGVPLTGILFDAGLSSDDGSIADYQWDFGDGQTLSGFGPQVYYAYRDVGTYTVSLTVIDNLGASHTSTTTATIATGPPPSTTIPPATTTLPSTTTTPSPTTTTGPGGIDGAGLYGQFCAGCHGGSGQGGPAGPSVQVSTASTSAIASWISNGVGSMPGFAGVMSQAQIDAVAVVTRGMQSATATTTTRAVSPPDSINAGVLYGQFCAGCHGGSGQGGPAGPSVQVSTASTSAIASWITSGVGTMPGFAGTLSGPEITAIAALTRGMQSATATTTTTVPLDESATGAEIYTASCAGCHGADGEGTASGPNLIQTPLPAPVVGLITAEGAGTMPGFSDQLSSEQIDLVAAHVGALAGSGSAADGEGEDTPAVPTDPAEALYLTNCAACHGAVGEGGTAGPLEGLFGDAELVDLIVTGPSTMPAYADILTDAEIDLIVGHVQLLVAPPTTEVAGSTIIRPAAPTPASEQLGERLGSLGSIGAIDNRDGLPIWIALVLTMVAGTAAVVWILLDRISTKAVGGETEGKT